MHPVDIRNWKDSRAWGLVASALPRLRRSGLTWQRRHMERLPMKRKRQKRYSLLAGQEASEILQQACIWWCPRKRLTRTILISIHLRRI